MKVLLLERVTNVWKKWEIKEVKSWYAANFLFPKKLAVELTPAEEQKMLAEMKKDEKHRVELIENRHAIVEKLQWKNIEFKLKVCSNTWKIFGWIGEQDIIWKIKREFGLSLSKKHINMWPDGHIKKIWERDVFVKLWKDSIAKIRVIVKAWE